MYNELKDQGFEILDFPCNQYGEQAPGTNEEVHSFCTGNYGTTFPRFGKVQVNGEEALPLFKWLTANTKFEGLTGPAKIVLSPILRRRDPEYKKNGSIKWNFTKFLIDRNGEIAGRFEPTTDPKAIAKKVKELL